MASANIQGLKILLADTYTLYLKTQNYHWNVVGPNFIMFHELFEKQYHALEQGVDDIAERLRSLESHAPGSFAEFMKLKTLSEATAGKISAEEMLEHLVKDHRDISHSLALLIAQVRKEEDDVTEDLLIERLAYHTKASWMIRSHLE